MFPLFWIHPVDAAAELFQLICFFAEVDFSPILKDLNIYLSCTQCLL